MSTIPIWNPKHPINKKTDVWFKQRHFSWVKIWFIIQRKQPSYKWMFQVLSLHLGKCLLFAQAASTATCHRLRKTACEVWRACDLVTWKRLVVGPWTPKNHGQNEGFTVNPPIYGLSLTPKNWRLLWVPMGFCKENHPTINARNMPVFFQELIIVICPQAYVLSITCNMYKILYTSGMYIIQSVEVFFDLT